MESTIPTWPRYHSFSAIVGIQNPTIWKPNILLSSFRMAKSRWLPFFAKPFKNVTLMAWISSGICNLEHIYSPDTYSPLKIPTSQVFGSPLYYWTREYRIPYWDTTYLSHFKKIFRGTGALFFEYSFTITHTNKVLDNCWNLVDLRAQAQTHHIPTQSLFFTPRHQSGSGRRSR